MPTDVRSRASTRRKQDGLMLRSEYTNAFTDMVADSNDALPVIEDAEPHRRGRWVRLKIRERRSQLPWAECWVEQRLAQCQTSPLLHPRSLTNTSSCPTSQHLLEVRPSAHIVDVNSSDISSNITSLFNGNNGAEGGAAGADGQQAAAFNTNTSTAQEAGAPAVAEDGTPKTDASEALKVFAGNLAFATSDEELKKIFSEAGEHKSSSCDPRHPLFSAMALVTFATSEAAAKSVSLLNGKEIDGRVINVAKQSSLSAGGGPKGAEGEREERRRSPRKGLKAKAAARDWDEGEEEGEGAKSADAEGAASGANGDATSKPRKKRTPKSKKGAADGLGHRLVAKGQR
ncbi:hypothetical protein U1Q18_052104 [Sarracenia purpurea var. burkii]